MRNKAFMLILAMVGLFTISCNRQVIYTHYNHVDNDGWERSDTMHFCIPAVKQTGTYHQQFMLRTNNSLPFLGVSVIVEQEVFPTTRKFRKRIDCNLVKENGRILGSGISNYQYTFDLDSILLNEGDSLNVHIMHHMKLETMPGVSDVGYLISQ